MFSILAILLILLSSTSLGNQQENVEKALRRLRDSVDRFEANFHRAADDYAKAGLVRTALEERATRLFRLDDHSTVDFPSAVAKTELRLQQFFDSKVAALRRLVTAAEKAASSVDIDAEMPILLDRDCALHLRQLNRSSVKNEANWVGGSAQPKSGVHVATESYKCSGPVARDFNWTSRSQLEQQMAENARQDAAIARQYIGTYSGLTRTFPGFHWDIGSEQFSIDLFDPRFRPWFVAAESAPRDVLFLLDFSGSAKGLNAHLIKTTVMAVLQTLTPNDFFSGIWYNSKRERVLANCTEPGDSFIQATSRNKLLFRRFLDRVEERDQASLPAALEMGFAEFVRSENGSDNGEQQPRPARSGGHRLVLLFTDGIEFWPTEFLQRFQQQHPNEPIRVFGHSIGHGRGPQEALAWLTCQTKAGPAQAVVGSVSEVRLKARGYLRKLNELLALAYRDKATKPENRPISWPTPYMDVQRGGPILSLSMPVLGPQPKIYEDLQNVRKQTLNEATAVNLDGFMGVAGIDISFQALQEVLALQGESDSEQAYAFLVDNNGLVYFHPRLQTPPSDAFAVRRTLCHRLSTFLRTNTRVPFSRADEFVLQQMGYLDSIAQMDILQLEQPRAGDELMRRFRTNLVLGRCGETLEDERRQLRCFAIRGTPLVAGFVLRKNRPKVTLREQPEEDPFELAERLRSNLAMAEENFELGGKRNGSTAMPNSVGILLREDQTQQFELSSELSRTKAFGRFDQFLRLLPRANAQFVAHLSAIGPDSLFPAWASKWPKEETGLCPSRTPFVSAFFEVRTSALLGRPGLMAVFPRCELSYVKSFLRTSAGQEESTKLTVTVDTDRDGMLSVEQPLGIVEARKSLARVGVQLRGHYLQQKLLRALQQPADGWAECLGADRKCLLVNAESFVLASSNSSSSQPGQSVLAHRPSHLSQAEPELFAELLDRGLIQKTVWRDPTGLCPMVMELRQRQQHFPAQYYMAPPTTEQTSSAMARSSLLDQVLRTIFSWVDFVLPLPVLASSMSPDHIIPLEEAADCEIEPQPELIEHCTLERTRFRLKARAKDRKSGQQQSGGKTATALWLRQKNCNRTIGLLPFGKSEMFLLFLDGQCLSEDVPATAPNPAPFIPHIQVPNCNLTMESLNLQRRQRMDLDYSRSHPKEFNPICTSGSTDPMKSGGGLSFTLALALFSSLLLFYL